METATTVISPHKVESWADARDYYANGGCADLAWAITQETGWRMGLLFMKGESVADHGAGHVFAIRPDGMLIDIHGAQIWAEMSERWASWIGWNDPDKIEFVVLTDNEAEEIREAYTVDGANRSENMDEWWALRLLATVGERRS